MYKSKRQKNKSFDWYGLSQRFSIRKYHFGAASVLLGTALILGAAQTTAKAEEAATENKTEAVASVPKDEKASENVANVTTPALSTTTEAAVVEKPTLSDEEVVKLAAETSKKDDKAAETATTEKTEVADKEKATLTAPLTDKKAEKAVDEKADKKDEKKAENPITATKTVLEQLTSEAEVLNTTASNFADKKAEDKAGKEAIATAVASAKVQIEASKKALAAGEITKQELDAQLQRISSAIEAVYAEMKRAGHVGKVEAVLDDVATNNNKLVVKPAQITPVANYNNVTEEEIAEIIRQFRIANPDLTDADKIKVNVNPKGNLIGETTVTLANGQEFTFPTSEVIKGYTANRNTEQLKKSINWFDFGSSKITYTDGTKVGEVKHLSSPVTKVIRDRYGVEQTGVFTYYREVTYADGRKGTTLDDEWLKNGPARYSKHFYNDGRAQNMNGRDASSKGEFFEALQEGMKFTVKTSVEGYELTATVTSLAPKNVATNPFKDSNGKAYNVMNKDQTSTGRRAGDPVDVVLAYQDKTYSHMKHVGLSTDNEDGTPQMTAFTAAYDSANVGVNFSLSATYNSRPVAVNAIAVDAEEAGEIEVLQFETDGTNWEQFLALNKNPKGGNGVVPINSELLGRNANSFEKPGYKRTEWLSTDKNGNVSMYGTKLFGPAWTTIQSGNDLPVGLSQNVSNLSIYMNTQGSQAGTIGFVIYDGGDAPATYGSAQHFIGNLVRTNSDGSSTVATQPYLGSQKGDPDFRSVEKEPSGAWALDDLVNTDKYEKIELQSGRTTVTNEKGETGIYEIQRNGNTVIRKADGSTVALRQDDILSVTDPKSKLPIKGIFNKAEGVIGVGVLADEGESQLLDPAVATNYALRQGAANEYELKGVRANPGTNNEKAYIRGWVDFNNNGKFDLYEASELVEVTKEGTYTLKWKNTPQLLDTSVDNLGVRLRIALDKADVDLPTGVASSGEVEDFQTHVVHPPRGTRNETKDFQGREQKLDIRTTELFTATGKTESSKYTAWNQMEPTVAPKFVLTESVVASEEPTGNTNVNVVDPEGTTVYKGSEVVVKDKRGNTLGTAVKVVNPTTGKTEYYLSKYTEYDTAGNKVGEYTLNKAGENGQNIKDASGNYRTTVDFKPEAGYVGTARGAVIRGWDQNRNSTGWDLTDATLKEILASDRLADKDKLTSNVNNEYNGSRSMDAVYIPTVIDVKPVGEDTTTENVQGAVQKSNPTIPVYGTVETVSNDKVEDVRYTSDYVILDKTKKPTFATKKEIPGKFYRENTKVTEPTTITLDDGTQATFAPKTLPAGTPVFENDKTYTITGTGNVTLHNVNYGGGTVPAGAKVMSKEPTTVEPTTVIRDGAQVVVPTGQKLKIGDVLVTPLNIRGEAQRSFWEITYKTGENVPGNRVRRNPDITLANDTTVDQLVGGSTTEFVAANGKTYSKNSVDTIPAGTREKTTYEDLMNVTLPNAVHIDPVTGAVTSVPRRYTKVTDTEIVIENEGTYTLNQDTGEITFTPDPKFVGTGTGVTKQQPDIDYNNKVAGDPVTSRYGTDYGKAKYTPIVKPQSKASITRTIHYVYENDNDNPTSQDSYKDNNPIVAIDNTPVTRTQTIDYTRDYQIFTEAGETDKEIITTNQVTDAAGTTYKVGQTIPKGTKFNQGTIIIGKWTSSSADNSKFKEIISPTVKGYTAEVVTADFTPRADGKMGHIHNNKQPVGIYTPVEDNTKDVGAYEPLVSEVTSDDTDNFDMYVVYKADKQKAKVTYIDLDATGDARILEVQNANTAPATNPDAKTTYGVTTLEGKSHTKIPYLTAKTIKKYEDQGYELVTDDYTNNTQGTAIEGGRKFDDDKDVDQAFNVYLRHKKVTRKIKDTQEVTRTIEYKYASTDDVPTDKRGTTAAPTVTETLHFERDRTIDYTLAAKVYPTEYATYKAVLDKSGYDSPEEYKARTVYYDHITNKAIAADATDTQKSIVTFGPWTPVGGTSNDAIKLSDAEKVKDDKFNLVNSPEVTGYVPDNATVEATAAIDAEADDYKITVLYTPVAQKAVVKFVEVDPTNTNKVITPGLADPVVVTGKSEAAYPATTATSVTDKIAELAKKGYELVNNGFVSTDKFDKDAAVDQEYVVKFKAKVVDIPSFDPTKPASNDNPKPTPGVTPLDPSNPDGPKWTEALINAVKVQEEVTRTIKYVYEDGTPVAESNLTSVADKKVKTLKFTRPGKINVATGEITYGDWSANQKFEAVTSPVLEKYTAAVAGVTPTTADVPEKTVAATDKDFEEVVVYKTKLITVDPKAPGYKEPKKDEPINPNDPNGPKWTDELLAKLKNTEEVTRTISYTYSTEASELNQAEKDGNKAGTNVADPFTTKVNYTRVAQVNPVTGEITYGEWEAKDNDTTLEGKAELPKVAGYVATGDVDSSKKDVTSVKAEDKDITEKVVYKALGKYVPVVPEGFTPPTIQNPQYPNSDDPSKPGDPTTTTTIPYVPGTTPVGPDGQPLTPKNPANKEEGYLPPAPTTPTGDTTIVYTKDGSQVAVTKFVDTTGKGLEPSVVDTGDTGKAFTKDADVTAAINKILARGYEKVANVNAGEKDYPSTDAEKVFDADASTNQEYTVTFKPIVKDIPTDPTTPGYVKPEPGQPVDPTKPDGPKWPESVKDLKTTESVTRTIKYVYENATPVEDGKLGTDVVAKKVQTLEFTRTAKVNLVTGEVEYGAWTPKTTDGFEAVITPTIDGYTSALVSNPTVSDVPAKTVTADAADYEEVVVYKTKQITIDPKDPNFDPEKPVDPKNPNGPKYKDLKLAEEVKRTITYTYADDVADTSKRGTDAEPKHETTVSFTRTASVNGVTGEITYSEWTAKDNDTTLEGKAVVPVKTGYVATGDVESSKQDVTGVNATDKDIIEKVIYKDLGKFVPVVPEGFTPPTIENPQYPNNPDDPTKPGTPTTTIPYVPGTTPVGPDGQPLTQKDPNDPTKGYNPPTPTNPTEDTTIVYTKDGSQVAVVHFIEVNSETDKTEKGGVAQSIVDTGDTGKAFTKGTEVTATIEALKAKGYTVVENNYPENGKFDADSKTNQEYKVLVAIKPVTVNPNDPAPTPDKPIDPNNPTGPKWTPELIKELEDGRKEEVKRTINYVYADGKKAADSVEETKEFKRSATINPVTGKITFGDWSPAQTFEEVTSPEIKNYTPNKVTVPASEVTATAEDINETVVYTTKPVTLDPSKPADPNTPAVTPKPEDKVPNDPKGRTYKELGLIEEVTHTVHYKLADGSDAGIPDNVQTLTFTRTADLDPVTGAISNFSDWKAKGDDTTIDSITTPDKPGYVASAAKSTARENVKATDKDSEETIIYRKLGSYVPVIPEGVTPPANTDLTPKPYPNDPNDPTKPGTPAETPVVPYIPGTTPVGPNGKPLTPKDPNDPTKGYEVPKVPEDPTQNTTITYVKDGSQVALVHFIKADGTAVHVSVAEAGDTGKAIKTTNVDNVKAELEAKGYEVVEPTDPAYTAERVAFYAEENRTFDDKDDKGDKGISQVYYVIVKEGITPIDPDKPLDPNNPNVTPKPGDKVPGDPKQRTYEQLGLLDEVNRTINYRYANTDKVDADKRGQEARPTVEQKLRYSRKGDLNKVTGEITYTSDWTEPQTLAEVTSPVIEGYVADIKAAEKVENVAHDAADSVVNVVYTPLGKYVPKVPEGFEVPNIDKPQYPNDPTDPTKPGTPTTSIPYVPGTTPKDPNGNPLKPVDPNDPSKGYVPPTPENPTEDTEITYEKDTQKAKVTYVVEGTGTVLHTDNLEGKSGEPIKYSTADKLADLKKLGYDLVTDGFTTATDKNYDKDTKADQVFEVTVKPHVEPLKPVDPENPNDPNKPKPGDPIDPNNPNGPKWTEDLIKKIDTTRHVNRTITYVNEKGEEVAKKVTDKVTFTREAKINTVTGEITYGDWTAKDGDKKFDAVTSPVVKGYILKDAKQKEVAATENLTADSKDENIEVVYTKLGSWVPKVPNGETPIDPIPYPNDPKDPTKPGTDKPIVPHYPGTEPKVPKDPTKPFDPDINPLVPLTPVDPKDPSKGYEVPPVPTEPGKNIEIIYETDKQKAITKFVDENDKEVSTQVVDEGDSGANFNKSKVDEVTKTIERLEKAGYRVVNNNFPSKDTDRVFDKDKSVDQKFTVTVAERIIPVTPGKPVDPNDPNLPKNPDGTPITPSKPEPGKPVFPNDPNSPVWPDSVKDMVTEKAATRTIKYVDRDGKEVSGTRTETIKFTREAKVNLVTGVITYGKWTTDRNDDIFNGYPVPVVKGYIAKAGDLESSTKDVQVTPDTIKDINETVIYDKLGSWIPNIPGTPTNPITYPNDPKDPTKPGTDKPKVPYVPGFIPVDPNGNPLKPVDPNDPTKGYEVPDVPADPTQDTPIKYIPVHTPNNGGGNNGGGGGNIPTPQPQPNPAPAPQPEPSPAPNPVPVTPETPEQPVVPVTPEQTAEPATPQYMDGQRELPNTGTEAHSSLAALGLLGALSGFGLIARKKRKDEE
ncbi:LPXTG-motif cell wall anchor domain protein [Streptococcus mitis]|uniref:LPXTG-motif cell wall anchor domain protein n=1 Tax=Streptococcus mitis TaxID=28037 RepID=A0A081SCL1_STRMT|nr:GEVED domain-containing protein [Streptococcus mitis]KER08664.1 LPXTG-motif cell wall anchor domain protein [Streptococcus mitis]